MKLYKTESGCYRYCADEEAISRLQVDFLAYSYLYYYCDISLIPDSFYDSICNWLLLHKKNEPKAYKNSTYYDLCKELDESGSGFYLKESDYPEKIKQVCVRLLTQHNQEIPEKLKYLTKGD